MPRATALLLAAALAATAAGCGGGGPAEVATVGSTTATTTTSATPASGLAAFASCMRTHGVTSFPDPQRIGPNVKLTIKRVVGDNPRYQTALRVCSLLLPQGGPQETPKQRQIQVADALSFARCMRAHGLTRFPDPTPQGDLSVQMVQAQGIDVHSPAVLRIVQTCLPASHGALTPSKVREAIRNAGG